MWTSKSGLISSESAVNEIRLQQAQSASKTHLKWAARFAAITAIGLIITGIGVILGSTNAVSSNSIITTLETFARDGFMKCSFAGAIALSYLYMHRNQEKKIAHYLEKRQITQASTASLTNNITK